MKCTRCGAETEQDVKFCTKCGAPMEMPQSQGTAAEAAAQPVSGGEGAQAGPENQAGAPGAGTAPAPNKKFTRILTIVIAVLAVVSVGVLAFVKLTAKDPKEVVISAFENIWPEDQVLPSEELFGLKAFADSSLTSDTEFGLTLKLDRSSDPVVNQYAGSGLRLESRYDRTNKKSEVDAGVIYNGMDLVTFDAYYGDNTLMMSVPELSEKVFALDLSEGLGERIADSPYFGPMMEQSGVDVEGFAAYFNQMMDQAEEIQETGTAPFDVEALLNRYREGSKAQENFKAALTVEKGEKGTYTMNGKEVSCKGYLVTVSKDSMIEFLETSSDFFLQDETLKGDFLKQMESSVRMMEIMGGSASGMDMLSAQEIQEQTYEDAKKSVDEMIDYLDASLRDVEMTVYVDKKGNLAAVEGVTQVYPEEFAGQDVENVDVTFSLELQGGTYLTQNFKGAVTFEHDGQKADMEILREGSYDGKKLTDDISVDLNTVGDSYFITYTNTYDSEDGSYHTMLEGGAAGTQILKASISGVLDELEKGKSFHMDIDALEVSVMEGAMLNLVLSGEYYYGPLEGEIAAPEGEAMDIVAAGQSDWEAVGMEIFMNGISLMGQLGVDMY